MIKPNRIAFQGIHGAQSELASQRVYPDMKTLPLPFFEDVFEAVENGNATIGFVPIENSKAGRVAEIHMLLPHMNLFVVGEYFQRIEHHLMAPPGADQNSIHDVYSHSQALLQCRKSLLEIGVTAHAYSDTAQAAADVAEWGDPTKAALASALAADFYNLKIIRSNMEDADDNTTLFLAIAQKPAHLGAGDKQIITSLFFETRNIPAALYKALGGFATNNVNLLKLESYIPGKTSQRALFFATLVGHQEEHLVRLALDELRFFCEDVRILGSYIADPARFT